jgi:hypothetical protein
MQVYPIPPQTCGLKIVELTAAETEALEPRATYLPFKRSKIRHPKPPRHWSVDDMQVTHEGRTFLLFVFRWFNGKICGGRLVEPTKGVLLPYQKGKLQ